jgi:hypothetical protein
LNQIHAHRDASGGAIVAVTEEILKVSSDKFRRAFNSKAKDAGESAPKA